MKRETEKGQICRLSAFRIEDNIFYGQIETSGNLNLSREMLFSRNRPDVLISILDAYHIAKLRVFLSIIFFSKRQLDFFIVI